MCLMGQVLEHSRLNCARAPSLDQRGDVDMLIGLFCCQTVSQFSFQQLQKQLGVSPRVCSRSTEGI